jgi:hypothetical protein
VISGVDGLPLPSSWNPGETFAGSRGRRQVGIALGGNIGSPVAAAPSKIDPHRADQLVIDGQRLLMVGGADNLVDLVAHRGTERVQIEARRADRRGRHTNQRK